MLDSIVKSGEDDDQLKSAVADVSTTAISFAKGGTTTNLTTNHTSKAVAVAGGIALRALVKSGKLGAGAAESATGGGKEVQVVGVTAVNKLLGAVEDIIEKTVKNVLDKVKKEVDKERTLKTSSQ